MSICKVSFSFARASLALIGGALLITGCAEPAPESEQSRSTPQEDVRGEHVYQTAAAKATRHPLVGVWLGQGTLDTTSVAIASEGLSQATQQEVESSARIFLATEMAIEFKGNGIMETAIEVVNKFGKRESGVAIASWEASQTMTSGEYRVAAVEEQADGSKVTDYKTFRVSDDGQRLQLMVDLPGVLGQCQPRIVLERQKPRARIAQESAGSADLN